MGSMLPNEQLSGLSNITLNQLIIISQLTTIEVMNYVILGKILKVSMPQFPYM